jgi:hypothetical protein
MQANDGKRYFSPETRAKLSASAKARWERIRAGVEPFRTRRRYTVREVLDDEVTAKVEILRKLLSVDELAIRLGNMAKEIIDEAT